VEVKSLMQNSAKFCEVFALKFASLSLSTKLFRVICRSCKYFCHLPPYQTFNLFHLSASVNRNKIHYFEVQVHNCKGHLKLLCSLTKQGKNCECDRARSFLFIDILDSYMLLFHQSTVRIIYCVW